MGHLMGTPDFLALHGRSHRALERAIIATGRPGLQLRFYPGVRDDARAALKAFARWLRRQVEFRHPVRVTVVPHVTVLGPDDGAAGWAVFEIPSPDYAPGDVIRIYLGAGQVEVLERHYAFRRVDSRAKLLHDLAHEVVHYEQWRDGREVNERGVNRRAAALVARYRRAALRPPRLRRAG